MKFKFVIHSDNEGDGVVKKFDLDDEHQIVIYSKGPISSKGTIELTGKVIKI